MKSYTIHSAGLGMKLSQIVSRLGSPIGAEALAQEAMVVHPDRPRVWNLGWSQLRIQFSPEGKAADLSGETLEISGEEIAKYDTVRSELQLRLGTPHKTDPNDGETKDYYFDSNGSTLEIRYARDRVRLFRLFEKGADDRDIIPYSSLGISHLQE